MNGRGGLLKNDSKTSRLNCGLVHGDHRYAEYK
jgi:hypothetical protein